MTGRVSREVVGGNEGLDDVISVAERFTTSSKYVLTLNCQLITCLRQFSSVGRTLDL